MTTLSAHTTRAIHNKGMQAVYGIAAEYDVPVEDVIALLGTTSHTSINARHSPFVRLPDTTPSQPVSPPVPAAQTGEGLSSSLATSPVKPIPEAPKPLPDAPDIPADALVQPAEAKTSAQGALSSEPGGVDRSESTPPPNPPAPPAPFVPVPLGEIEIALRAATKARRARLGLRP